MYLIYQITIYIYDFHHFNIYIYGSKKNRPLLIMHALKLTPLNYHCVLPFHIKILPKTNHKMMCAAFYSFNTLA